MFNYNLQCIMAKSKNGGSRAYLRGRIGSDVYSIGKNGKGDRQQVVRSLAETVANPRTQNQMFGRMVMSTVMQAVSALQPIIDHSFDGFSKGQPSISEFIRQNYALIKADAIAHPSASNTFGLKKYQEKGITNGAWKISSGKLIKKANVSITGGQAVITVGVGNTLTVANVRAAMNVGADGYVTFVALTSTGRAEFCRLSIDPTAADNTVITSDNIATVILVDASFAATPAVSGVMIQVDFPANASESSCGAILSDKEDGAWIHSTCVLGGGNAFNYAADVALPTYPTGSEQYLNGGDL